MQARKIRDDIYWVGAIDWSMRNFHGYDTSHGSSYNAYLILDDKITLIDTVKEEFCEEFFARLSSVVPLDKIDYIVSNHAEPDHAGSLVHILKHSPTAKIFASSPQGVKALKDRYGDFLIQGVKKGDTLSLGKRTLQFLPTPLLHWPDSMVTYSIEDKILFSNDAFGQHLASGSLYDDENDQGLLMYEAKKYYANILMLYSKQAQMALNAVKDMDLSLIATGHGIVWRSHIADILRAYEKWSTNTLDDETIVVYDTMWHSTETIAHTITEAFMEKGMPVSYYNLRKNYISDIVTSILTAKYLAVGSPTINNQMLPTVGAFFTYLRGLTAKKHLAFAFGSYGWGGQSVQLVEEELKQAGCDICLEKIRIPNIPSKDALEKIRQDILAL